MPELIASRYLLVSALPILVAVVCGTFAVPGFSNRNAAADREAGVTG
ncbi:hypothetical protein ACLMAL_25755 [Nocardia sp. CWNU-33]